MSGSDAIGDRAVLDHEPTQNGFGEQLRPLRYEPHAGSILLAPLQRTPSYVIWGCVPLIVLIPALICLTTGSFAAHGFSRWTDFAVLIGLGHPTNYSLQFGFVRDSWSIGLIILVGLTVVCLHYQWRVVASCVPELESNGAWKWRSISRDATWIARWIFGTSVEKLSPDPRTAFQQFLDSRVIATKRSDRARLCVAVVGALALTGYESSTHTFKIFAPNRLGHLKSAWAIKAYDNWWASWHHPVGLIVYAAIIAMGIYVILAQNAVALDAIRAFLASLYLVDYDVDWLNTDGVYGWRPVQRIFRITYMSMALRALELTLIIAVLGWRNLTLISFVAAIWIVFLCIYIGYPYLTLHRRLKRLKQDRISELAKQFENEHSESHSLLVSIPYLNEIERIRSAAMHPMQLTKWQSSSFYVVVLLPIVLTIAQIVSQ